MADARRRRRDDRGRAVGPAAGDQPRRRPAPRLPDARGGGEPREPPHRRRQVHRPLPGPGLHGLGRVQVDRGGRLRARPHPERLAPVPHGGRHRHRRRRPGRGRLPELPLSGGGAGPALDRLRPGARALLCRPPVPGRGRAPSGHRRGPPAPDRPALRGLSRRALRARQAARDARPPGDRDGAHRALPGNRRARATSISRGSSSTSAGAPGSAPDATTARPTIRTGCPCGRRPRSRVMPSARCT